MNEQNSDPRDENPISVDEPIDTDDDSLVVDDTTPDEDESIDESVEPSNPQDEMDVDAALAAVSQLTLLTDEAQEDDAPVDADYTPIADDEETVVEIVDEFEIPRDVTMRRGQLSSILPAVTLIILGGWLTFTLTTSSVAPSAGLLLSVVLIGIGVVFLSQWLTSARWSRGNFFVGTSILLIGGIQFYLSQVTTAVTSGWALWIVAVGIALFGAGYLTLPRLPRLSIMGILTIVAGGIGYVLTSGAISTEVIGFISNLWIVGAVILGFMLIAPFLRRRG